MKRKNSKIIKNGNARNMINRLAKQPKGRTRNERNIDL